MNCCYIYCTYLSFGPHLPLTYAPLQRFWTGISFWGRALSCLHMQRTTAKVRGGGNAHIKSSVLLMRPFFFFFYKRKKLSSSRASDFTCTKGIVWMWVCVFYIFICCLPDGSFRVGVSLHTLSKQSPHCSAQRPGLCFVCVFLTQTHFNKFSVIHFLFTQGSSLQICLNRGSIGLPPLNNWCLLLLSQPWLKSQNIHWLE